MQRHIDVAVACHSRRRCGMQISVWQRPVAANSESELVVRWGNPTSQSSRVRELAQLACRRQPSGGGGRDVLKNRFANLEVGNCSQLEPVTNCLGHYLVTEQLLNLAFETAKVSKRHRPPQSVVRHYLMTYMDHNALDPAPSSHCSGTITEILGGIAFRRLSGRKNFSWKDTLSLLAVEVCYNFRSRGRGGVELKKLCWFCLQGDVNGWSISRIIVVDNNTFDMTHREFILMTSFS